MSKWFTLAGVIQSQSRSSRGTDADGQPTTVLRPGFLLACPDDDEAVKKARRMNFTVMSDPVNFVKKVAFGAQSKVQAVGVLFQGGCYRDLAEKGRMFPIRRWVWCAGTQWSLASAAQIARLTIRVDPRSALLGMSQKGQTRIHPDGQTCDLRSTRQAPLRSGAPRPPAYRKHPSFLGKAPVTPALKQNAHLRVWDVLRGRAGPASRGLPRASFLQRSSTSKCAPAKKDEKGAPKKEKKDTNTVKSHNAQHTTHHTHHTHHSFSVGVHSHFGTAQRGGGDSMVPSSSQPMVSSSSQPMASSSSQQPSGLEAAIGRLPALQSTLAMGSQQSTMEKGFNAWEEKLFQQLQQEVQKAEPGFDTFSSATSACSRASMPCSSASPTALSRRIMAEAPDVAPRRENSQQWLEDERAAGHAIEVDGETLVYVGKSPDQDDCYDYVEILAASQEPTGAPSGAVPSEAQAPQVYAGEGPDRDDIYESGEIQEFRPPGGDRASAPASKSEAEVPATSFQPPDAEWPQGSQTGKMVWHERTEESLKEKPMGAAAVFHVFKMPAKADTEDILQALEERLSSLGVYSVTLVRTPQGFGADYAMAEAAHVWVARGMALQMDKLNTENMKFFTTIRKDMRKSQWPDPASYREEAIRLITKLQHGNRGYYPAPVVAPMRMLQRQPSWMTALANGDFTAEQLPYGEWAIQHTFEPWCLACDVGCRLGLRCMGPVEKI